MSRGHFSNLLMAVPLLGILFGHGLSFAMDSLSGLPGAQEISRARQRSTEMLRALPEDAAVARPRVEQLPRIDTLPRPGVPAPDIETVARKFGHLGTKTSPSSATRSDLLVFVSFSMPREALVRTIEQAARVGATLVFRGLKDDSMAVMGNEIGRLLGGRNVSVVIHPPAFHQFSIKQVPAVVLASGEAGNVMDNGCASPGSFAKVSGDVTLAFALDQIERKSDAWSAVARSYRLHLENFEER